MPISHGKFSVESQTVESRLSEETFQREGGLRMAVGMGLYVDPTALFSRSCLAFCYYMSPQYRSIFYTVHQ